MFTLLTVVWNADKTDLQEFTLILNF